MIGIPLLKGESTKRPFCFYLVQSSDVEPRFNYSENLNLIDLRGLIQHDIISGLDEVAVTSETLYVELQKRNQSCDTPLSIFIFCCRYISNMMFFDTPALFERDKTSKHSELLMEHFARQPDVTLMWVEDARTSWQQYSKLWKLANKLDRGFTRSIFVYSKFHFVLRTLSAETNNSALLMFFRGVPNCRNFFISGFSAQLAKEVTTPRDYAQYFSKSYLRDLQLIENDVTLKPFTHLIGSQQLFISLLSEMLAYHKQQIPAMQSQMEATKGHLRAKRELITTALHRFSTPSQQRKFLIEAGSHCFSLLGKLIQGTAEVPPRIHGQTWETESNTFKERTATEALQHTTTDQTVPMHSVLLDTQLFGGQQLQRLLETFRSSISEVDSNFELLDNEIGTVCGILGTHSAIGIRQGVEASLKLTLLLGSYRSSRKTYLRIQCQSRSINCPCNVYHA